jgi:hypothetical protein
MTKELEKILKSFVWACLSIAILYCLKDATGLGHIVYVSWYWFISIIMAMVVSAYVIMNIALNSPTVRVTNLKMWGSMSDLRRYYSMASSTAMFCAYLFLLDMPWLAAGQGRWLNHSGEKATGKSGHKMKTSCENTTSNSTVPTRVCGSTTVHQ